MRAVCGEKMLYAESVLCKRFGDGRVGFTLRTNERTNERTNDDAQFGGFVNHPCGILCDLCYIALRTKGRVAERNTVCAAVVFHDESVARFTGFINYAV